MLEKIDCSNHELLAVSQRAIIRNRESFRWRKGPFSSKITHQLQDLGITDQKALKARRLTAFPVIENASDTDKSSNQIKEL